MIYLLKDLIDIALDRTVLIIAAGGSISLQKYQISRFISKVQPITIGINKITHFYIPDYHLWTNNQRLYTQGDCIHLSSKLLFGKYISPQIICRWWAGDYFEIDYDDDPKLDFEYIETMGKLRCWFRTAGCLAIGIAHLMGAKNIYIVGMDGFTIHTRYELDTKRKNQHCYGHGYTDDYSWEDSLIKDEQISSALTKLSSVIYFKILTSTKYDRFYDGTILQEYL